MRKWILLLLAVIGSSALLAQDDTRNIVFNGWRQEKTQVTPSPVVSRPYRRVAPASVNTAIRPAVTSPPVKRADIALGITVWRMDAPKPSDPVRLLVLEGSAAKTEFTPRRVEANEPLRLGDKVRLSIESPKEGYLYIVDEEIYADGTFGPPYLIFPVQATRNGENRVRPGQLIEIPDQMDPVNVFTIRAKDPKDRGERLTIFLSPNPNTGLPLSSQEQRLADSTFRSWLQQFDSRSEHFELLGGKGQAWTRAEQQAAVDPRRLLTLSDPVPQTVFLFSGAADKPLLARVTLKFAQ